MKSWLILLLFFFQIFILSCSQKHEDIYLVVGEKENCLIVKNNHEEPLRFSILIGDENPISDYSLFKSAGGDLFTPNSLDKVMLIFSYVCNNTYHKDYETSSNILYKPSIAISSLGGGLCSIRSGVLTNLLRMNGFKADSYVLSGHVITIVELDGRNIVLDPDFGLWYYNEKGQVASYEELCNNSKLITNPINPILNNSDADYFKAYSSETATLYATVADNYILNSGYLVDSFNSDEFILPPEAVMEFPVLPSINPDRYGFAIIDVPAGITGAVSAPLIIAYISGTCLVEKNGKKLFVNKNFKFDKSDAVFGEFNIIENENGIKLFYFINPLVYCINKGDKVSIVSKSNVLPEASLKANTSVENLCCFKEDLLDLRIRQNIANAMKVSNKASVDIFFNSFISSCKKDSLMSKYFLWDSLLYDYSQLSFKLEYPKKFESMERVYPELLRRFITTRFDERCYFPD